MRDDITGLRALAVIPVLLFHAKIPFVTGGFLGVDLFFVISGFLITGDILRKIQRNEFSFVSFYDRRARRILPALLFVMITVALLSPFFMVPYDIKSLGQSIFASTFAANNILLYLTSGYWSLASEFKPLYHTWSLGVEEQYYFIVPIIFVCCYRFFKRISIIQWLILIFIVSSFTYSFFVENKEYNFLILFTRVWELMAGGMLAVYMSSRVLKSSEPLAVIGIICIVFSFLFPYAFSTNQAIINLLPVLGACLIIGFSGGVETCTGRLLSSSSFVFIGLISYSVYLWHQPLIAFFRLSSEVEPDPYILAAVSFLSIPLAYMTWRFIENPARDFSISTAKRFYPVLIIGVFITSASGLLMHKTYGFQEQFPQYSYDGDPQLYVDQPMKFSLFETENSGKERLVVLGNSFARDFINMLIEQGLDKKYQLVYEEAGCSVTDERLQELLPGAQYVILASNWAQTESAAIAFRKLQACIQNLNEKLTGQKLFIFGAKNFGWNNNFVKMLSVDNFQEIKTNPLSNVVAFNRMAAESTVNYIDVLNLLMDKNGKVSIFSDDGKFITYDTNHLTRSGARYLATKIFTDTALSVLNE